MKTLDHRTDHSKLWRTIELCVQILLVFLPACAEYRKNSCVMSGVESLLHGSWLLSCDAMKRRCVSCVCILQRGHNGDGCVLASTLYKYDLEGDLFVLSWARVQRVLRRSISSELLMCCGGVHSILLARCLETIGTAH